MERKAEGHDVGIVFPEFQGRGILWKGIKVHPEEIHCEFPVEVVQLIVVFLAAFQLLGGDLGFIMQVIRAFRVDAFVDNEVLPVFLWDQGMGTVRAPEGMLF